MNQALLHKTDAHSRRVLRDQGEGSIEASIRTDAPLTPEQQSQLQTAGFTIHFGMGNVVTGVVRNIGCLDTVAELPFIKEIELSRPLYPET